MTKNYSWYGEFNENSVMNLKALCYDLECKYSEFEKNGKQLFSLSDLSEEQSMFLVSNVTKYGLTIQSEHPGRVLPVAIKMSLDLLLNQSK